MARLTKAKLAQMLYESHSKHTRIRAHKDAPNWTDAATRLVWEDVAADAMKLINRTVDDEVEDALAVERSRKR